MSDIAILTVDWEREREALLAIRFAVFVDEQGVPAEIERDDDDEHAMHLLARTSTGVDVGTARLLSDGHIGRIAVLRDWRCRGIGTRLLAAAIAAAGDRGLQEVRLHAQCQAIDFYTRQGFRAEGPVFDEAGIAHRSMRLGL